MTQAPRRPGRKAYDLDELIDRLQSTVTETIEQLEALKQWREGQRRRVDKFREKDAEHTART